MESDSLLPFNILAPLKRRELEGNLTVWLIELTTGNLPGKHSTKWHLSHQWQRMIIRSEQGEEMLRRSNNFRLVDEDFLLTPENKQQGSLNSGRAACSVSFLVAGELFDAITSFSGWDKSKVLLRFLFLILMTCSYECQCWFFSTITQLIARKFCSKGINLFFSWTIFLATCRCMSECCLSAKAY